MQAKIILVGALWLAAAGVATAAEENVLVGAGKKLGMGAVNTLTGIVELPVQTVKGYQKGLSLIKHEPTSKAVGTVLGFFRGIGHTAGRTASGAWDVATFWSANRESNAGIGIPLDARFAWQQGVSYSVLKPNLMEGLMPYPRKLGHGLADAVVGVVDLPGQIVRGARQENPLVGVPVGVVRGLWFSLSRTTSGLGDAVLFLAPNPEETMGYGYDHAWPWGALVGD